MDQVVNSSRIGDRFLSTLFVDLTYFMKILPINSNLLIVLDKSSVSEKKGAARRQGSNQQQKQKEDSIGNQLLNMSKDAVGTVGRGLNKLTIKIATGGTYQQQYMSKASKVASEVS